MTSTTDFGASALQFVESFGSAAHGAVDACRSGGDRLAAAAAAQWDRSFAQARPRLSPEARRNAMRTRKVAARYWRQGLAVSTHGADRAVDVAVDIASAVIARAGALRQARTAR